MLKTQMSSWHRSSASGSPLCIGSGTDSVSEMRMMVGGCVRAFITDLRCVARARAAAYTEVARHNIHNSAWHRPVIMEP